MSEIMHHRARVGALSRSRANDDPEYIEARQSLRTAVLAEHVKREVEAFPPLTAEQRARIAALLRPEVTA